jgi:hypothetical protein
VRLRVRDICHGSVVAKRADNLQVKGTVEDAEALVTPWQYTLTYHRHPGEEIVEYLCDDNNRESVDPRPNAK